MSIIPTHHRQFVDHLAELAFSNPFTPRRTELEALALGDAFDAHATAWNLGPEYEDKSPNIERLLAVAREVLNEANDRMRQGQAIDDDERDVYEALVLFVVYHASRGPLDSILQDGGERCGRVYDQFVDDMTSLLGGAKTKFPAGRELPHLFACFFQIRRAFSNIFHFIIGTSGPAMALRAAVWQSIFTHDMRRYRRSLYQKMTEYSTLITGPTGTGKELVARAVGLSRYVPFDSKTKRFATEYAGAFFPLNLSAMSPTLIESELFGHKRGSFTGAVSDRVGWLESCGPYGSVFLDEMGELDPAIQVKLLRVLQTRTFSRLGETRERRFEGKMIAATNRDPAEQMRSGAMREDFYYRLCSDTIETPSLRDRLDADAAELPQLIRHIAARLAGDEAEAVATEALTWIKEHMGNGYPWPGNIRELEQCVRSVMIRRAYHPSALNEDASVSLADDIQSGRLTADELLTRYCQLVYEKTGSYQEAGRQLGLDRRTVRARIMQ